MFSNRQNENILFFIKNRQIKNFFKLSVRNLIAKKILIYVMKNF